jgi:galactokinase
LGLKISTPGRICLFGEHQDYLGLPVIAAAISKRITIEGEFKKENIVSISMPDINEIDSFEIEETIPYKLERDYLRSSVNILLREGFTFSNGIDCMIKGDIPINAGTSSSSAMVIAWINILARMSDQNKILSSEEIAYLGYKAEVLEFSEPGGMMDHYSTAIGNVIWLESVPKIKLELLRPKLGSFILANSLEPKDTKYILSRVKKGVLNIAAELSKKDPGFSLQTAQLEDIDRFKDDLNEELYELLRGTIRNRDITFEAHKVLSAKDVNEQRLGRLMNEHQTVLRDVQRISTTKINKMIETVLDEGALGAKINGSGGGGCMFAYAPNNTKKILEAVKRFTNEAWIVNIDEGTRVDE